MNMEIDKLKKEISNNRSKVEDKNDLNKDKCINFISQDHSIIYGIPCSGDSIFAEIEEILYKEYPELRETNNLFLFEGKEILRFKTVNENKIVSGKPILLVRPIDN